MALVTFIRDHREEIIAEFARFARTLMPPGMDMSDVELRDHADDILAAVIRDMRTAQTSAEQMRKSEGRGTVNAMHASAKDHADDRIQHGFTFRSVLAEFRALRATVLRLYEEDGGTDLSQARRFNEAIDEALTESMDRFAVQTDFFRDQTIGILSHDLRTPLGAITTGAALLTVPEDNPERRARVASRIVSSAQRMQRMIADLLDLTRARLGGEIPLTRTPSDLQRICEEVITEAREAHGDAVVHLEAEGDLAGHWDPDRLAQVVSNLVGNAIQHGDGTPITVIAQDEGADVTLLVRNGGAPIPSEVLPSIFEPLARGRPAATQSIGLGLFIARAVVSGHGGYITVTSSAPQGTAFTVRLPKKVA
jgi:signal transduction histidine kinase